MSIHRIFFQSVGVDPWGESDYVIKFDKECYRLASRRKGEDLMDWGNQENLTTCDHEACTSYYATFVNCTDGSRLHYKSNSPDAFKNFKKYTTLLKSKYGDDANQCYVYENDNFNLNAQPWQDLKTFESGCLECPQIISCFTQDSLVSVDKYNYKKIKDIKVGDFVLANNNEMVEVVNIESPIVGDRGLASINDSEFFVSPDHIFKSQNNTWLVIDINMAKVRFPSYQEIINNGGTIKQMKIGDFIEGLDGSLIEVYNIKIRGTKQWSGVRLYDLTLKSNHVYYVNDFAVHNCSFPPPTTTTTIGPTTTTTSGTTTTTTSGPTTTTTSGPTTTTTSGPTTTTTSGPTTTTTSGPTTTTTSGPTTTTTPPPDSFGFSCLSCGCIPNPNGAFQNSEECQRAWTLSGENVCKECFTTTTTTSGPTTTTTSGPTTTTTSGPPTTTTSGPPTTTTPPPPSRWECVENKSLCQRSDTGIYATANECYDDMDGQGNCGDGSGSGPCKYSGWECENENECSFRDDCCLNECYESRDTCEYYASTDCDACSEVDCEAGHMTINELYICCVTTGEEQQTCVLQERHYWEQSELAFLLSCIYIGCYDGNSGCCCGDERGYSTYQALVAGENVNCEDPQMENLKCTNTYCCQPSGTGGSGCDIIHDVDQCCGDFTEGLDGGNQFMSLDDCNNFADCNALCGGACGPGEYDCGGGLCVEQNGGCCENCNEGWLKDCDNNKCVYDNYQQCCSGPAIPEGCTPGQTCPFFEEAECMADLVNCP